MLGTEQSQHFKNHRLPRYSTEGFENSTIEIKLSNHPNFLKASPVNFSKYGLAFRIKDSEMSSEKDFQDIESLKFAAFGRTFYEGKVSSRHAQSKDGFYTVGVFTLGKEIKIDDILGQKMGYEIIEGKNGYGFLTEEVKIIDEYQLIITQFRNYLSRIKKSLATAEEKLLSYPQKEREIIGKSLLLTVENSFKERSDYYYHKIMEICQIVDDKMLNIYKEYFQFHLLDLITECPFAKRCIEKPLGYSGDYEVMNMIYGDHYQGDSLYAKAQNKYCCTYSPGIANIDRLNFFKQKIEEVVKKVSCEGRKVKITSLGSGPAKEILDFIDTNPLSDNCIFTCVDLEPKALEYAQEKLLEIASKRERKVQLNFVLANVVSYLRSKPKDFMYEQDLLYASGLYDYLKDSVSQKLTEAIYPLVREGGEFIVVNASITNPWKLGIEFAGEWYLHHRSQEEMLKLAVGLKETKGVDVLLDKEQVYWFLSIKK